MHHEGNRAGQYTEGQGGGMGEQPRGIGRSLRAGIAIPPTVLVTQLDTGELVLQGRPDGPRAYLSPADAMPLKQQLAAAFERAEQVAQRDQGEAR